MVVESPAWLSPALRSPRCVGDALILANALLVLVVASCSPSEPPPERTRVELTDWPSARDLVARAPTSVAPPPPPAASGSSIPPVVVPPAAPPPPTGSSSGGAPKSRGGGGLILGGAKKLGQPKAGVGAPAAGVFGPSSSTIKTSRPAPAETSIVAEIDGVLKAAREALAPGGLVHSVPRQMKHDHVYTVEAVIANNEDTRTLAKSLAAPETAKGTPLAVGPLMTVTLIADPAIFAITALTPAEQPVMAQQVSRWQWNVRPLRTGTQALTIVASANFFVPGQGTKTWALVTHREDVDISIEGWAVMAGFFSENWKYIGGSILAPAFAWVGRRWWKKRKSKAKRAR